MMFRINDRQGLIPNRTLISPLLWVRWLRGRSCRAYGWPWRQQDWETLSLYKGISQQLKLLALGLHRLGLSTVNHGWGGAHEALMDYWQVMDSGIVNAFACRLKGEPTRLQWMVPNLWPHRWSLLKPVGAWNKPKRHEKGTCREAGNDRVRRMEDESKQTHYVCVWNDQGIDLINLESK